MSKLVHNYNGGTTDEYGTDLAVNRFLQGDVLEGFTVVANATPNMTVYVQPGSGRITTGTYPSSYGYLISHDTTLPGESVTVPTAAASPRIDYIVAYVDKGVAGSTSGANVNNSNNVLKFADVSGTPAGSPLVPTTAQIQTAIGASNPYIILAQIAVGASVTSITNPNITDMRKFISAVNGLALGAGSYVNNGCVWSISSGLAGAMTAGLVYVNIAGVMVPVNLALISSRTFTASKDTYVSVSVTGTITYSEVTNNAASPSLPVNSVWLAIVVTSGSAITSISQSGRTSLGNQVRPQSGVSQSAYVFDIAQHNYSTAQTILTAILANAPAGDYAITATFAIEPNGGGNASMNIGHTSSTGILSAASNAGGGIHAADGDYSTSKWAHRTMTNMVLGHQGGTFNVTLSFSPETAVAFQIGNSNDARWGSSLSVVRA